MQVFYLAYEQEKFTVDVDHEVAKHTFTRDPNGFESFSAVLQQSVQRNQDQVNAFSFMQDRGETLLVVILPKAPLTYSSEEIIAFDLLTKTLIDSVLAGLKSDGAKKPFALAILHESDLLAMDSEPEGIHVAVVEKSGCLQCSVVNNGRLVNSDDEYNSGLGTVRCPNA